MSCTKHLDLTGNKYGRLTVVSYSHTNNSGQTYWVCKCDCGKEKTVRASHLKSGNILSCGCLGSERASVRAKQLFVGKGYNIKHGGTKTRLFRIWLGMKQRCGYKKAINYNLYGGRGITVCDEWLTDFAAFRKWATENGYSDELSIDRIDNSLGYSPANCRWSTREEQQNNRRCSNLVTFNRVTKTVTEWAKNNEISRSTIYSRISRGWNPEIAITKPSQKRSA